MYNNTSKPYRLHFNLYKIAIQREGIYKRGKETMTQKYKPITCTGDRLKSVNPENEVRE